MSDCADVHADLSLLYASHFVCFAVLWLILGIKCTFVYYLRSPASFVTLRDFEDFCLKIKWDSMYRFSLLL